jgi:hypothetical protein
MYPKHLIDIILIFVIYVLTLTYLLQPLETSYNSVFLIPTKYA